jgi:hypothetical protein
MRGSGASRGGAPSRSGARPTPTGRNGTRSGGGNRPAPHSGTGRPASRNTGTGLRPANPRLLRQRLFVFVVVTLLVAVGIALVQGCQSSARGLGGDGGGVRQEHAQGGYEPQGFEP